MGFIILFGFLVVAKRLEQQKTVGNIHFFFSEVFVYSEKDSLLRLFHQFMCENLQHFSMNV